MAEWCNARLVVTGSEGEVRRFSRIAGIPLPRRRANGLWGTGPLSEARASCVFRADMLVGEAQAIFSERATSVSPDLTEKKYIFQVCGSEDDAQDHFRKISRSYPSLRFVYVYGWDSWDEYSYGSCLIYGGHIRGYRVPLRLVEKAMAKHGVDDNPNDEWPCDPEMDAERELMDLAEEHWAKGLRKR